MTLPPAIILVGGVGSRLKAISGPLPKPMVPIADRPFLEHLLRYLHASGVRKAVLCVGHGADMIRGHFGSGAGVGLDLDYSVEEELQGTGGAIRLGFGVAQAAMALVLNGDSFVEADLSAMLRLHQASKARVSIALAVIQDVSRFGVVEIDDRTSQVTRFSEKHRSGAGLINAGVYLINRDVVEGIPRGVASFERDVLPGLIGRGLQGFISRGMFVDIGVPEDYQQLAAAPGRFLAATGGVAAG